MKMTRAAALAALNEAYRTGEAVGSDLHEYLLDLMEKAHPREHYVVAVFLGYRGRMDEQQLLVEVFETYETGKLAHGFRAFDVSGAGPMHEVRSHKLVELTDGDRPPREVDAAHRNYWWRRVR